MTRLWGWGANLRADCVLVEPETPDDVARRLDRNGTIARGLGRSYGDAALNSGRQVLGLARVDRYLAFDAATGTLTCEAGVSLAQLIDDFTPRGWFPMITPGTKFVTVGGCIANDVHGKAHHAQGAFSACVDAMTVLLASGEIVRASRDENADLFWATFGGHGLAGRRAHGDAAPAPDRDDVLPPEVDPRRRSRRDARGARRAGSRLPVLGGDARRARDGRPPRSRRRHRRRPRPARRAAREAARGAVAPRGPPEAHGAFRAARAHAQRAHDPRRQRRHPAAPRGRAPARALRGLSSIRSTCSATGTAATGGGASRSISS